MVNLDLAELADKYGTDKKESSHDYIKFYKKHLSNININKFLEIGVYKGQSAAMWSEWLPNKNINIIDITAERIHKPFFEDKKNIILSYCDAGNRNDGPIFKGLKSFINEHGSDWDVIIDDGGHTMEQQQTALGFLFKHVKPGGVMIIEDLHTSYIRPAEFNATGTKNTTLKVLEDFKVYGRICSEFIFSDEAIHLENEIDKCIIEKGSRSEIAFVYKKK